MKRKLNVLFYGLSHEHAAGKLRSIAKMTDDFNLVAVVDDRESAKPYFVDEQAEVSGVPLVPEAAAFDTKGVDLVFVETTNRNLMKIAAECVARNLPMHCDKPCGETMEPYRSLVETCRAKNIPFQIGYMYRGNPALRFAWKAVREGWLGDVAFVEADMNHDYGTAGYESYIGSFKGGILYNLGCHLVDMVVPFARGKFVSAIPLIGDAPGDPKGSRTNGASLIRFEGTNVLIRTCSHMPGGILCRRLRVDGSNGTLEIRPIERFDGRNLTLELSVKNPVGGYATGTHVIDFGVQDDRYAPQLADLAAIVRGDKPNDQDYARDLLVHDLTLKACGIGV